MYCEYSNTSGTAYFDAISLTRDYIEYNLDAEDFEDYVEPEKDNSDTEDTEENFTEATDSYGNNLTETTVSKDGTIYRSFGYGNKGNDLVRETDPRGYTTEYTVDPITSRTVAITDRCGAETEYEYDSTGRTTKVTSGGASVSYGYNAMDNMTEIVRGDGMKYLLEYDAFNNLESIGIDGTSRKAEADKSGEGDKNELFHRRVSFGGLCVYFSICKGICKGEVY